MEKNELRAWLSLALFALALGLAAYVFLSPARNNLECDVWMPTIEKLKNKELCVEKCVWTPLTENYSANQ